MDTTIPRVLAFRDRVPRCLDPEVHPEDIEPCRDFAAIEVGGLAGLLPGTLRAYKTYVGAQEDGSPRVLESAVRIPWGFELRGGMLPEMQLAYPELARVAHSTDGGLLLGSGGVANLAAAMAREGGGTHVSSRTRQQMAGFLEVAARHGLGILIG